MKSWIAARLPLLALLFILAALPLAISAGVDYCEEDPIVKIGDDIVNIWVGIPRGQLNQIEGSVRVVVEVPKHTPRRTLFVGHRNFQEELQFVQNTNLLWNTTGRNTIKVTTHVPGKTVFPIRVRIIAEGVTTEHLGLSNSVLTAHRVLDATR